MTWSRILVGTDGTERAGRAVAHAASLAAAVSAELTIVTAYGSSGTSQAEAAPADLAWAATAAAGAEDVAYRAADSARSAGAPKVRTRTVNAAPADGLAQVAEDIQADLIVVGSKGMTSSLRFLTGSVPNELSHHIRRDLLIVRTD
ncbi:MAG TPA: universal stress protein [Acidimicrobiales bacterium]|nr:universal stress protein [Acidimicrobiales bacterium]